MSIDDEREDAHRPAEERLERVAAEAGTDAPRGRPRAGGWHLRRDAHHGEAYDGERDRALHAGPCSRTTTPGSGPAFQLQATGSAAERDAGRAARRPGRRAARRAAGRVRSSVAPFVARKPARPGCVSSSTPHQEPVAVRRLNGHDRPGTRVERELVERRRARERRAAALDRRAGVEVDPRARAAGRRSASFRGRSPAPRAGRGRRGARSSSPRTPRRPGTRRRAAAAPAGALRAARRGTGRARSAARRPPAGRVIAPGPSIHGVAFGADRRRPPSPARRRRAAPSGRRARRRRPAAPA